jgi:hypothetical protein
MDAHIAQIVIAIETHRSILTDIRHSTMTIQHILEKEALRSEARHEALSARQHRLIRMISRIPPCAGKPQANLSLKSFFASAWGQIVIFISLASAGVPLVEAVKLALLQQ